jgi:putative resolvase
MLLRISLAAQLLGVCTKTLRRWEQQGKLVPVRTPGNHRRYDREALQEVLKTGLYQPRSAARHAVALYARVSSKHQEQDLSRQLHSLRQQPLVQQAAHVYEFTDIASGLNDTRKGLLRLLRAAAQGQFTTVVVTYGDRLSRFGLQLLREVFHSYGVKLLILEQSPLVEPQQRVVTDIVAFMHSFSGKLYRMRRGRPIGSSSTSPLSH